MYRVLLLKFQGKRRSGITGKDMYYSVPLGTEVFEIKKSASNMGRIVEVTIISPKNSLYRMKSFK